jgi:hypothetical protein
MEAEMFCAYCGEVNNSSDRFCKKCGKQIINMQPESPVNDAENIRPVNDLMGFNPDADSSNDDILMYSRIMKEGRVHEKDDPKTQEIRQQESEDIQETDKFQTKNCVFLFLTPFIFIPLFYLCMGLHSFLLYLSLFGLFVYFSIRHLAIVYASLVYHYFKFRYMLVGLVFLVVRLFVPMDNIFSIPLFTIIFYVVLILVTDWKNINLTFCPKRSMLCLISVYAFFFTVFECGLLFMYYG